MTTPTPETLRDWPALVWGGRIHDAFVLAIEAAKPGVRRFMAYGISWRWTFIGIVLCKHTPYDEVRR